MPARQSVSPDARGVLAQATIDRGSLKLNSGPLEPSLSIEVNEVLARPGGKWHRGKTAAHLFDTIDAAKLRDCLDIVLATGLMPPKNPNAFYFTPKPVQKRMLELFKTEIKLKSGMRFLEPSAGKGHLYSGWKTFFEEEMGYTVNPDQSMPKPACWVSIEAIEIDESFRKYLESQSVPIVYAHDFLSFLPNEPYDGILMNPPFDRESSPHLYIDHILHAYNVCLKPGAPLVSVTTVGFTLSGNQRIHKVAEFKELVEAVGAWEELPEKSFADAGTSANTCLVTMQKPEIGEAVDVAKEKDTGEVVRPSVSSLSDTAMDVPEPVMNADSECQEQSRAGTVIPPEPTPMRVDLAPVLAPEGETAPNGALGTLSTFGLQVSGSEAQVAAFEGLWNGIAGRKALYDLRKISAAKTKKAQELPVAWQHTHLQGIHGSGYFHRTKFKHEARLTRPEGPSPADQSSELWEVSLREGPIEELVNMLKQRYSLVLLDDGGTYKGSLRHALVEALKERLPELALGALR